MATTTDPLHVGFARLGRMGRPMARHLVDAEFPVIAYNRTRSVGAQLPQVATNLAAMKAASAAGPCAADMGTMAAYLRDRE